MKYNAWANKAKNEPQFYKRADLHQWAEEARERGDDFFYARPVDPNNPYGELELCEPDKPTPVKTDDDVDDVFKTRQSRCRHHGYTWDPRDPLNAKKITSYCKRNGINDIDLIHNITVEQCERCPHFKSRFIEYPISVTAIKVEEFDGRLLYKDDVGKLAKVRPCGEEYGDKTYLGIFLGDIPQSPHVSHNPETGALNIRAHCNPAIFVPKLNKIIFGCESWWSIVRDEKDLDKEITDELINNQWYVRLAKLMDKDD